MNASADSGTCSEANKAADEVSDLRQDRPRGLKTVFLISVMVVAGPLGNVLLSMGMKHVGSSGLRFAGMPHTLIEVLGNGTIWLGIGSLLTFFVANILVLSYADYSFVQPSTSMAYGMTALLAILILHEHISPLRWLGVAVICVGVLVVGRTNPRTTDPPARGFSHDSAMAKSL